MLDAYCALYTYVYHIYCIYIIYIYIWYASCSMYAFLLCHDVVSDSLQAEVPAGEVFVHLRCPTHQRCHLCVAGMRTTTQAKHKQIGRNRNCEAHGATCSVSNLFFSTHSWMMNQTDTDSPGGFKPRSSKWFVRFIIHVHITWTLCPCRFCQPSG